VKLIVVFYISETGERVYIVHNEQQLDDFKNGTLGRHILETTEVDLGSMGLETGDITDTGFGKMLLAVCHAGKRVGAKAPIRAWFDTLPRGSVVMIESTSHIRQELMLPWIEMPDKLEGAGFTQDAYSGKDPAYKDGPPGQSFKPCDPDNIPDLYDVIPREMLEQLQRFNCLIIQIGMHEDHRHGN